ncbi:MAG: integrase arm-type DNA-binding domain-containing protein [Alphaproteobacteria bacterium]|jgi:integrase|nr:integrase arm-type DNA-binding domain-containing protein [Alphaproteobacteria bacterium]
MPVIKLTKRVVETAQPQERDVVMWDTLTKGFGCKVTAKGRKVFVLKYRVGGGRSGTIRKPTIGVYGDLTVDQAREIARGWKAEVRNGGDPSARRQALRKALTVTDLGDLYLSDHVALHNKPSTAREARRMIDRHVRSEFGKLKVSEISRTDISRLHKSMKRTPYEANRVLGMLSKMFNLAEAWGYRPDGSNPCRLVQRYRERARERFLSVRELCCLGEALAQADRDTLAPPGALALIRFLALTGCRVGEALALEWQHVDLGTGIARIMDAKTGNRGLALSAPALALLSTLSAERRGPVFYDAQGMPFGIGLMERAWLKVRDRAAIIAWRDGGDLAVETLVVRLTDDQERLPTVKAVMAAALEAGVTLPVGLQDARMHDLRHTVGTYASQAGANAFLVRDLLGHKTLAMTGRYVEWDADPSRALANAVASRISAAMDGYEGEVVPFG